MDDVKKQKDARSAYKTLLTALDSMEWKYERDDEKMRVDFSVRGDDLAMNFIVLIDEDRQLIRLLSFLPFNFPKETRVEGAIATSQINYKLAEGSFDYDLSDGETSFRQTSSFRGSLISPKMLQEMVNCAVCTVDDYNDKLFMLSKGVLSLNDFIGELNE